VEITFFKSVQSEGKFVKSWQLHYVMYNVYKKDFDSPYIKEFNDRDAIISEFF